VARVAPVAPGSSDRRPAQRTAGVEGQVRKHTSLVEVVLALIRPPPPGAIIIPALADGAEGVLLLRPMLSAQKAAGHEDQRPSDEAAHKLMH
jgi:hypothetical protein